jgi:hypothetical protein
MLGRTARIIGATFEAQFWRYIVLRLLLVVSLFSVCPGPALSLTIPDESGYGHDAVFEGSPEFVGECVDSALAVIGELNYGVVQPTDLQMVQQLTVEGYFRWDGNLNGPSEGRNLIDKMTQFTDAGRSWFLTVDKSSRRLRAGVFYSATNDRVDVVDPDPLPDPMVECSHVAFTVEEGGELRLYRNGELKDSAPFPGSINYADNTWIGFADSQNESAFYDGILDDFRISDRVRESFPVGGCPHEVDEHTIALWRFGEESPTPNVPHTWGRIKSAFR